MVSPNIVGQVHIAIVCQNRLLELDLPKVSRDGIGINHDLHMVPTREHDAMAARDGLPAVGALAADRRCDSMTLAT